MNYESATRPSRKFRLIVIGLCSFFAGGLLTFLGLVALVDGL
ncbi:MAG: hypothetical protein AAF517_20560 [Planctomycetota bacterium]